MCEGMCVGRGLSGVVVVMLIGFARRTAIMGHRLYRRYTWSGDVYQNLYIHISVTCVTAHNTLVTFYHVIHRLVTFITEQT